MNRRLLVPLLAMLALFLLVGGASAAIDPPLKYTALGLTERGYFLSSDDEVTYIFDFPMGMTIRPRIEVAPASSLRVQASLDAGWDRIVDDSCDDAVVEIETQTLKNTDGWLTIKPCPGTLDIDTPFFVTINYDPMLQELEHNVTSDEAMWLHGSRMYLDYEGAIDQDGDTDVYRFEARPGQVFRATMMPRNSNVRPWLVLVGLNSYQISGTSCGLGTCVDAVLPENGPYILYVRSAGSQVGGYQLSFDFGDDISYEPNDSPDHSTTIVPTGTIFAAIEPVGDVDYYGAGGVGSIMRIRLGFPPGIGLAHAAVAVLDRSTLEVIAEDVLSADHPSFDVALGPEYYILRISDADNGTGDPDAIYYWPRLERIGPYVSSDVDGLGGRYARKQGDVLWKSGPYWYPIFDASDVGITQDVTAAEFLPNGTLLLALGGTQTVAGLGKVTAWDIIRYVPNTDYTSGVFQWYLDGSDVGLTTAGEKIDAIALSSTDPDDFELVVSLSGSGSVPQTGGGAVTVRDEDEIRLENAVYGAASAGTWAMHLDGSSVPGLAAEDVRGATLIRTPSGLGGRGAALLLMENAFVIDGVSGDNRDVLLAWQGFTPTALDVLGLAADNLGDKKLDAITIGPVLSE